MSDKTDAELIAEARAYFPWRHPTVSPFDPKSEGGPCAGCIAHTFADRLEARNAEVAELKRLLKWAWDNAIGRLESEERDEGFVCRLLQFPDGPERNAVEKIVGEK